MKVNTEAFKDKCQFAITPRYELFLALAHAANSFPNEPTPFSGYKKQLGDVFRGLSTPALAGLQFSSVVPSLLHSMEASVDVEKMLRYLNDLENRTFLSLFVSGLLHEKDICEDLIDGKITLQKAINKISKKKREWLIHLNLYPLNPDEPIVQFLDWLLKDRKKAQSTLVEVYEKWWNKVFSKYWRTQAAEFEGSLNTYKRIFEVLDFEEFASKALLKIRIGPGEDSIQAMRGGYEISCDEIDRIYFIPSAYNTDRLWSAIERPKEPKVIYFPYLDLDLISPLNNRGKDTALDPVLMCRALGDPTRLAMTVLLAQEPRPAISLAQKLDLTRATVSHHVSILREAGALDDDQDSRILKVNWNNLSNLSSSLIDYLKQPNERKKK